MSRPKHPLSKYRTAYKEQEYAAKRRGIPFLISFSDWLEIWRSSGHWGERGRKLGQYCMARFGDKGAYEKGNVKIILHSDNIVEGNLGRKIVFSEEHKRNLSLSKIGRPGHPMSERTKEILRNARQAKQWAKSC